MIIVFNSTNLSYSDALDKVEGFVGAQHHTDVIDYCQNVVANLMTTWLHIGWLMECPDTH